jgi:hypothetical protein
MSKENNDSDNEGYGEEYNNYVKSDGIWAKLDAQQNAQIRTEILDRIYTRTRERIKEKGGMIRHEDAMKLVLQEDKQKILDDMLNDRLNELAKEDPVLVDLFKNESTKEDALRILHLMIEEMER